MEHRRARHARGVPDAGHGPGAGVGVPRRLRVLWRFAWPSAATACRRSRLPTAVPGTRGTADLRRQVFHRSPPVCPCRRVRRDDPPAFRDRAGNRWRKTTASGSSRDPSTSTTLSPSNASTVATTSIDPSLIASITSISTSEGTRSRRLTRAERPLVRDWQAELAEIPEIRFSRRPAHRIGEAGRGTKQRQRNEVARQAAG